MDSTTITLLKDILKGVGRNLDNGKKKGGIKAHMFIRSEDSQPCFIRYTESAKHDHLLLKNVELPQDSILCFDKGNVDYAQHEVFTSKKIWYVTRLKENALYEARQEFDIPDNADSGVLKDEQIELSYGKNKTEKHLSKRIAYWDSTNGRLFEFITNIMDLAAEEIAQIYKKRWQIELLSKQLRQNFPLKYFLENNENAIIIQIWSVMLANLLLMILKSQIQREWAFSNMVSVVRQHLMSYISAKSFFENPEKAWQELIEEQKARIKEKELNNQNLLFPNWEGAYF